MRLISDRLHRSREYGLWETKALVAVFVSLATIVVFLPSLLNGFVNWDDPVYILENAHIQLPLANVIKWAFTNISDVNWHPLTWISHAIDYRIWGLNPVGHHLTGNIIHALNSFLVVYLTISLLEADRMRKINDKYPGQVFDDTGILTAGLITGLLFGIHPMRVESVAWASERKDLLAALFFFLCLLEYTGYASEIGDRMPSSEKRFSRHYLLSLVFCLCALLSKPMTVTIPAVLIILDWYPFDRVRSMKSLMDALKEKKLFIVMSLGASIITILEKSMGSHIVPLEVTPFYARLVNGTDAIIAYLGKMMFPFSLSPLYPYPADVSILSWRSIRAVTAIFCISSVCAVLLRRRQKVWMAVWTYYLVTLLPVLGIVRVGWQSMADRYTYLPGLGPFLLVGFLAASVFQRPISLTVRAGTVKIIAVAATVFFISCLSYLTFRQIGVWADSIVLWDAVIVQSEDPIPIAYNNRGLAYGEAGDYDQALKDFDKAISLKADYPMARNNRGLAYLNKGMKDEAIADFTAAIALKKDYAEARNNRGLAYFNKGMKDEAIADFTVAIALKPDFVEAYNNRGIVFGEERAWGKALEDFERALVIRPDYPEALCNRGLALSRSGSYERAIASYTKAIDLDRRNAALYINRAYAMQKAGDLAGAASDFRRACELGSAIGCREVEPRTEE